MSEKVKEHMSWEQFDEACYKLAKKLEHSKFQNIYGIPRGGLVVAVRLSHLLDIPLITDIKDSTSFTLIVDDISDTGKTLEPYRSEDCLLCIATLYYHKQSTIVPDIWILEKKDRWILFPWEVTQNSRKKQNCPECIIKPVGVISSVFGHRYVCEEHAKIAENDGWVVDYENWRLGD